MTQFYARVAPDAFSDIRDVELRNKRIQQDLINQRRNFEAQQAAREFDEWQNAWNRKDYGYYDKDKVAAVYGKQTPFVGQAPSISRGLESLGITPEGKLTFGIHGSNLVAPFRNAPTDRKFRTDENGTPVEMTDEEMALVERATAEMDRKAAEDAQSRTNPQKAGMGSSAQDAKWYDFLKYPQNTPYEIEQMRNQGILRDAAIAAAMNKPIIYPEADTLTEPMGKLAGQQTSLAQSAMGQYTTRQGMAADMYKQVTNLANSYAAQSMQAQIAAQKLKANSDESANNARVYEQQAQELYGQMPDEMKAESNRPDFLEVVRSKYDEKLQTLAQQYDALKRSQAMLENDALSKNEQANSYLAKAQAFGEGVANLDKNWDLGLGLNVGNARPFDVSKTTSPVKFAKQGDIGINEVPIANARGFSSVTPSSEQELSETSFNFPKDFDKQLGKYGLKFDTKTSSIYQVPRGKKNVDSDPFSIIDKKASKIFGKDVSIRKLGASGSRLNLDVPVQAKQDYLSWRTDVQDLAGYMLSLIKDNSKVQAKLMPLLYPLISQGERFGVKNDFASNSKVNVPASLSLESYESDINKYKAVKPGEGWKGRLKEHFKNAKEGKPFSKTALNDFEKILRENFYAKNLLGRNELLLGNNGLHLNYKKSMKTDNNGKPYEVYIVDMKNSFK